MNTNFPEELNSRNLQARSATGLCVENQDKHIVEIVVCRGRHATGYPAEQGSASTPTAREGEKILRIFQETALTCTARRRVDKRQSSHSAPLTNFWIGLLRLQQQRTHRDVLHCDDPAVAFARRWRGGKPSRRRPEGRVETDRAARSVGGSHSVRTQASTTTGADRRWP